jgi:site-specific DNA-methyltransferase (cytosine-N4-specific)
VTAGTATILRANARTLPLADASVDLVVTSPPYFALRSYTDGGEYYAGQIGAEPTPQEYIASLIECTREWMRVLKPGGSIWVNLGDKYSTGNSGQSGMAALGERFAGGGHSDAKAKRRSGRVRGMPPKSLLLLPERYRIACVDELGLIARAVVIWSKPNGLPESVKDRVRRSHEDWVHLTKSPKYFASVDAIREANVGKPQRRLTPHSATTAGNADRPNVGWTGVIRSEPAHDGNPLGKLPGSVWSIASQPLKVPAELGIDHFAAFPMEWPRRIILGWSPEGGTVLDPFGGTGTTALVAKALGRNGISVDMSADYCRLAKWRTTDPAQFARAQRPANPPRVVVESVADARRAGRRRRDPRAGRVAPGVPGVSAGGADQEPGGCDVGQNVTDHTRSVVRIAEAYEKYLTDGTVPPAPEGRESFEGPPTPVADMAHGMKHAPKILAAALAWVDGAESGMVEPTRDRDLIDAVRAYRGLPPLGRPKL